MQVTFVDPSEPLNSPVVVGVMADGGLSPAAKALDEATSGQLTRVAASMKGRFAELKTVHAPAGLPDVDAVVLVGLGEGAALTATTAADLGGAMLGELRGLKTDAVRLQLDLPQGTSLSATDFIAGVSYGLALRSYRFDRYRTTDKPEDKPKLATIVLDATDPAATTAAFASLQAVAAGVALTRDLVSEPANVLNPITFADLCKSKLGPLGVTVEVLTEAQMQGWGALLGVAQGSAIPPRTVIMRWLGADDPNAAPLAVVGKGVCFDSGGLSLKPPASMEDMKWDMGGAGVVTGLMAAIAGRKAKVNVVGAIGLVENMPSGTAQRPGDIVTSLSGQTIEVLNTDAEGRLVLADVLWHVKETIRPVAMVDLATLTGAVIVSLGSEYAGLFANDDALSDALTASGIKTGEKLWRLPLHDNYDKDINCDLADMKNIGSRGAAGSITAAQFLKRFVGEVPWAHLDIAGVTWTKKDAHTVPKGASGFGVRLLDDWIASHEQG